MTWAHHALLGRRPQGPDQGPGLVTVLLGICFHLLPGLRIQPRRVRLPRGHLSLDLLHGDRVPRLPRHHRHHLPEPCACSAPSPAISSPTSISASRRRPGTGISSTWSGCSCSSASIGGGQRRASYAGGSAARGGGACRRFPAGIRCCGGACLPLPAMRQGPPVLRAADGRAALRRLRPRFRRTDAGDGPALFVVLILGAVVVGLAILRRDPVRAADLGSCRAVGAAGRSAARSCCCGPQGVADRAALPAPSPRPPGGPDCGRAFPPLLARPVRCRDSPGAGSAPGKSSASTGRKG